MAENKWENTELENLGVDEVGKRLKLLKIYWQNFMIVIRPDGTASETSILKRGMLISISGPPDPDFAKSKGLNFILKLVMGLISSKVRKAAQKLGVRYSFLFMRADGKQLAEIAKLIESGKIKPVIDKIFPFEATREALAYVEAGRATVRSSSRSNPSAVKFAPSFV